MSGYGVFARHYDALTANVDYPRRARYFDRLIHRHEEKRSGLLLDLACGTGSLSLEFCALGYEVVGADASAEMLSAAQQKVVAAGRSALFLHQSMEALDLYGTVDCTVCALDSINHLPGDRALSKAFARVSLFTNPGGLFLFDLNTAYKHSKILADNVFIYETDRLLCIWRNSYRTENHRVEIALDFFEKGDGGLYTRSGECFSERIFTHETIAATLKKNGFVLLEVYGGDNFNLPEHDAQRVVYVARKL